MAPRYGYAFRLLSAPRLHKDFIEVDYLNPIIVQNALDRKRKNRTAFPLFHSSGLHRSKSHLSQHKPASIASTPDPTDYHSSSDGSADSRMFALHCDG